MAFGFFASFQQRFSSTADGRTGGGVRRLQMNWLSKAPTYFTFSLKRASPDPNDQNLVGTLIPFNPGDSRASMNTAVTTPAATGVRANGKVGPSRFFNWADPAAWPAEKEYEVILHRPEHVIAIGYTYGASGGGNNIKGVFRLPILPNLESFYTINGTSTTNPGASAITQITGYWGKKLKFFHFTNELGTGAAILTALPKFPSSLIHFIFGQNSAGIVSNLIPLIRDCVNLKSLLFTEESWSDRGTAIVTPMTGAVDITFLAGQLSYFSIVNASGLTDLIYNPGTFANIKRINFYSLPGVSGSKFNSILSEVINSEVCEFVQIGLGNKAFARDFADGDLKQSVLQFLIYGNMITGSINFTSPKPKCATFKIGNSGTTLAQTAKNNFATVDVSGLTNATVIDVSNGNTEIIELPLNTVCTSLSLGGNKVDYTINMTLKNRIMAMTALQTLNLSTGAKNTAPSAATGQDSTNGIGELDVSTLPALSTLLAQGVKLTGQLKLAPAMTLLYISGNANLLGLGTGPLPNLAEIRCIDSSNFNLDFTRVPNLRILQAANSGITILDLSARTSTITLGTPASDGAALVVPGCLHLTEIRFPANEASAVVAVGSTNTINISGCPLLSSLPNIEKLSYSTVAQSGRSFIANNCALNIDFKFGVNGWLPTAIQIQNNGMSASNVDANIDSIYSNILKWGPAGIQQINIGGTNAAASGTFQAPAGYKSATIAGISRAATAIVTVTNIGSLANNDLIRIREVVGMTEVNGRFFRVKGILGNTFELWDESGAAPVNSSTYTAYVSGGRLAVAGAPSTPKERIYGLVNTYGVIVTYN